MKTNTFYLDMDGVIADWNAGVRDILGYIKEDPNAHYPDKEWNRIKDNERMYRDLPIMAQAGALISLAKAFESQLGWNVLFLSAVPKGNDVHWAFWDKCLWAQKNFPGIPVHFGPFAKDKQVHCKPGDILVDDRRSNCEEWRAAGGIAVEVRTGKYEDAINEIKTLLATHLAQSKPVD
jgi:hypothetical protein